MMQSLSQRLDAEVRGQYRFAVRSSICAWQPEAAERAGQKITRQGVDQQTERCMEHRCRHPIVNLRAGLLEPSPCPPCLVLIH